MNRHTPSPWLHCGEPIAVLALQIAEGSGRYATHDELVVAAEANRKLILAADAMCTALHAIMAKSCEPETRMIARKAIELLTR